MKVRSTFPMQTAKTGYLVLSGAMCVLGICLMLIPDFSAVLLSRIFGILLIRLHKSCCYGIVVDWIQGGMGDEILADLHRLGQLMDGYLESILSRCEAAVK